MLQAEYEHQNKVRELLFTSPVHKNNNTPKTQDSQWNALFPILKSLVQLGLLCWVRCIRYPLEHIHLLSDDVVGHSFLHLGIHLVCHRSRRLRLLDQDTAFAIGQHLTKRSPLYRPRTEDR